MLREYIYSVWLQSADQAYQTYFARNYGGKAAPAYGPQYLQAQVVGWRFFLKNIFLLFFVTLVKDTNLRMSVHYGVFGVKT